MIKSSARRLLRKACACFFLLRSRPLVLSSRGPILVIAPHPDDESLGCGALLARLSADEKISIHVVCFTESPDRAVATLRQNEFRQAMALLALHESCLHFFGAPDGRLKDLSIEEKNHWRDVFASLINRLQPKEIFLPCRIDGSSEHDAMFKLVAAALPLSTHCPRVLEFPVWSWWNPRFLRHHRPGREHVWRHTASAGDLATKAALLRCYPSQTESPDSEKSPMLSPEFLAAFLGAHEFYFESRPPS